MKGPFVREDRPDGAALPDLPIPPHPHHATERGWPVAGDSAQTQR